MYCWLFSSILTSLPSRFQLHLPPSCDNPKMSPDIAKCPLGQKITPGQEPLLCLCISAHIQLFSQAKVP